MAGYPERGALASAVKGFSKIKSIPWKCGYCSKYDQWTSYIFLLYNKSKTKISIALVDSLNFEKNMCTYFMINLPICGNDYVFDPMNSL